MSPTDPRLAALLDEPVARALREVSGDTPCHLVGGLLRDRLLGIGGSDFDASVAAHGEQIAERLARRLSARLVRLGGRAFAAFRLVGAGFSVDIWDRGGVSLEADLARRDFTVNAIAINAASRRVSDPFDGIADLERRRLRATTDTVFAEDPLRVLRLVRLSLQLPGFAAVPATLELARQASAGLAAVAVERVRDELGKVLRAKQFRRGFQLLVAVEVYPGLLLGQPGEPGDARRADRLLSRLERALDHLADTRDLPHAQLEPSGPRLAVLISGLPPVGGDVPLDSYLGAGYLTPREAARCRRLISCRDVPPEVASQRWFLHRWDTDWPAAAAMLAATADPPIATAAWQELIRRLIEQAEQHGAMIFDPPPLLNGDEIGRLLGIPPGPRIGHAVALLRRAQVEGRVDDQTSAEALLRSSSSGVD